MAAASKFFLLCWACWLGCAALSAAEGPSTNTGAGKRGRIVVLGDSITAGYGLASPAEAYPALLQRKVEDAGFAYDVVNAGVSGDTTAGGARRIDWALRGGADALVIALGGNDGLRGIPPQETAANLRTIVKRAREKAPEVRVIICGMQMPGNFGAEYTAGYRAVFPAVAKEMGAELVPFLLERVGGVAGLNQDDQIHPNAKGQQVVAENVWRGLERVLRR